MFQCLLLNFSFIALFSENCYYCGLNVCIQKPYAEAPTRNVIMFEFACKFRNKCWRDEQETKIMTIWAQEKQSRTPLKRLNIIFISPLNLLCMEICPMMASILNHGIIFHLLSSFKFHKWYLSESYLSPSKILSFSLPLHIPIATILLCYFNSSHPDPSHPD